MIEEKTPYEPPLVTLYGDLASLTNAVSNQPNSDALCAGLGVPVAGVPSNVVCKQVP